MNEVEIKVLNVDIDRIKKDILANGGFLVKKENQENHIFYLPDYEKGSSGYIRIRRVHDLINDLHKDILCVKKIISQDKYRVTDEHEVEVMDFEECCKFLNSIGIKFNKQQDKYRESYRLNGVLIEIDTWSKNVFPHPYLEIEADDENMIFATLDLLQIPRENSTSKTLEEIKRDMGLL